MLNFQYLTSLGVPFSKQVQRGFIFSPRELVVKRRHLTLAVTELNTLCVCASVCVCACVCVTAKLIFLVKILVRISHSWYSRVWAMVMLSWASGGPQPALVHPLRRNRYRLPSFNPWICHWVVSAVLMFTSRESTTAIVVLLTIEEAKKMSGQVEKAKTIRAVC